MARPRKRYPSDHRRWFRVYEDILENERLNVLELADQMLYIRLLAVLNRQKSRDGWGHLPRRSATALADRERWAYAEPAYRRLAAGGLVTLRHRDGGVDYRIDKWSELQGLAPAQLRRGSDETPSPTPTPTPTPRERGAAAPLSALSDLLTLVLEERPEWTEPQREAWVRRNLPRLEDAVNAKAPRDRSAALRDKARRWARAERETPGGAASSEPRTTRDRVLAHLHNAYPDREHFTEEHIESHWRHFAEQCEWGPYQPPEAGSV